MNFNLKKYNKLWQKLDAEQRARVMYLAQLDDAHLPFFVWTQIKGYRNKQIQMFVDWDKRKIERYRSEAVHSVISVLNNPKNNKIYTALYNYFYKKS